MPPLATTTAASLPDPTSTSTSPPDDPLAAHLRAFLRARHPPKTFCPSEVARALSAAELRELGCATWREAMPAVRELAWTWRDGARTGEGEGRVDVGVRVEVLQRGVVLGPEVGLGDVRGPIRLRRAATGGEG
ncbi:hypothetical protein LTR53_013488 [Teratosphaeriaceae sp. CCFEE 6253]|nr:hypothetical protein LTR53_013488 [Teratosphaeriaceae sp. CCFEE 6253]